MFLVDQVVLPGQEDNQFQEYVTFQGFLPGQEDKPFLEHVVFQGLLTYREQSNIMTLKCRA